MNRSAHGSSSTRLGSAGVVGLVGFALAILASCGGSASSPAAGTPTAATQPAVTIPQSTETPAVGRASSAPVWTFSASSGQVLPAGLEDALGGLPGPAADLASGFSVSAAKVSGDWAVISAGAVPRVGAPVVPTETVIVLAYRSGASWALATTGDGDAFCAALAAAPMSLVSADERDYFRGCK